MKRIIGLGVGMLLTAYVGVSILPVSALEIKTSQFSPLNDTLKSVKPPSISYPKWLKEQIAKEKREAAAAAMPLSDGGPRRTITYDVTTNGAIYASFAEFKVLANQTLNDGRGWSRAGLRFKEVASGGAFTLVLAEASRLPSYSSGCSSDYSCRAGRFVIINQDRWMNATPSWNGAGGSLRDYRHMVVNHETGHWLGHNHQSCGGAGMPAPVMQQQSISLAGCKFNPWPLASELWVGV